MNITQAKAAMKKLFGVKAMWRYDERAPTADERERVRALMPAMLSAKQQAKDAYEARRAELLKDPEYLRLKAARGIINHYRVTIGRDTGFAFHVVAQGDNWHDAIDKARAAKVSA